MSEDQPTFNEKIVKDLVDEIFHNRKQTEKNIFDLIKLSDEEKIEGIVNASKKAFNDYPGMKEEMQVKLDKLIEETEDHIISKKYELDERQKLLNKRKVLSEIRDIFLKINNFEVKQIGLDNVPEAQITQIGKVSREEINRILSETVASGEKLYRKEIGILIKTFEIGETIKTIKELEKIIGTYPKLKIDLKDILIDEILNFEKMSDKEKIKNNSELLHKIDSLNAIKEHFFKNDLK